MTEHVRVPLYARGGSVRAYTLVDLDDAERVGEYRWSLRSLGYAGRNIGPLEARRTLFLHRFLLGLDFGDKRQADHINRDRLDNRRSNLRIVTNAQNLQNQQSRESSSSRFRNVAWDEATGKWEARISVNGVVRRLGRFVNELDAAIATQAARDEHMPFAQPDPALVDALAALAMKDVAA